MPARVPLLFGTMTIGEAGRNGTRNSDLVEAQAILDVFLDRAYSELDTARVYAEGTTEAVSYYQLIVYMLGAYEGWYSGLPSWT